MPVERTPRRVSSSGSCASDIEGPSLKTRSMPSYSVLPASVTAARPSKTRSKSPRHYHWQNNIGKYACLMIVLIAILLVAIWEMNSMRQEIRLAAAMETLTEGEELFAPTDLEERFEEHLKTHLLEQKQKKQGKMPSSLVLKDEAVALKRDESQLVFADSAIEGRLSQFKQRFKEGSAPARIRESFEKRKEQKRDKILAQREASSESPNTVIDKDLRGVHRVDNHIEEGDESSTTKLSNSKLQGAPMDWKPRQQTNKISTHCADLKRGVCSVVVCEEAFCGCDGCDSVDFLEHCCELNGIGTRVKKVGPRTPLRVSRNT